jgi:hypothetical protein
MEFCLCGAILNLNAVCFGAIPDIVIELIVYGGGFHKQAVMTVAQWHRNQFIRGPKMDACLCDKRNNSIVKNVAWQEDEAPLANGILCLSTS